MKSVTAATDDDDSESQRASKKENSGVLGRRSRRVSAWPGRAAGATSERRTKFWRSAAARGGGDDKDLRSLGTGGVCKDDKSDNNYSNQSQQSSQIKNTMFSFVSCSDAIVLSALVLTCPTPSRSVRLWSSPTSSQRCRCDTQLELVDLKKMPALAHCHSCYLSESSLRRTDNSPRLPRAISANGPHKLGGRGGPLGGQICDSNEGSHLFSEKSFDLSFRFAVPPSFVISSF